MTTVYDFSARTIEGEEFSLQTFKGKVLLVVNTASACGFTPQFEQLEQLYRTFGPRGFVVLGFPCNQFGGQEPGNEQEIAAFCTNRYDVTFPMFSKINVNGSDALPLFDYLKSERPGILGSGSIKWNFTKFLIDRRGEVVSRHGSPTSPKALTAEIENLLAAAVE